MARGGIGYTCADLGGNSQFADASTVYQNMAQQTPAKHWHTTSTVYQNMAQQTPAKVLTHRKYIKPWHNKRRLKH